jgi:hypothetical protein
MTTAVVGAGQSIGATGKSQRVAALAAQSAATRDTHKPRPRAALTEQPYALASVRLPRDGSALALRSGWANDSAPFWVSNKSQPCQKPRTPRGMIRCKSEGCSWIGE